MSNTDDVFRGRPSRRDSRWTHMTAFLGSALVTLGVIGLLVGAPVWAGVALVVVGTVAIATGVRNAYK